MSGANLPMKSWILAMLGLTVLAVVIGGLLGTQLAARLKSVEQAHAKGVEGGAAPRYGADAGVLDLPPVITNLAEPSTAWVRLQTAIVYDKKDVAKPKMLAATITGDILAYMKTVTLAQIGGASELEHLREDLNERASIRSKGRVRELIIQTLVVQ